MMMGLTWLWDWMTGRNVLRPNLTNPAFADRRLRLRLAGIHSETLRVLPGAVAFHRLLRSLGGANLLGCRVGEDLAIRLPDSLVTCARRQRQRQRQRLAAVPSRAITGCLTRFRAWLFRQR
jgi:hypothetical protein